LVATDLANYVTAAVVGVWRDEMDGEVSYDSYVYISPQWEPEHAIYLGLAGKTLYFRDP
jgi:hypothetical protein